MKVHLQWQEDRAVVSVEGTVDEARCHCLENFWLTCLPPDLNGRSLLVLELHDVPEVDAIGIATVQSLCRSHLEAGQRIELHQAPQLLAHTFYKVNLGAPESGLTLVDPREDEPYPG